MTSANAPALDMSNPEDIDLDTLVSSLEPLVRYYQHSRSKILAMSLAQIIEALSQHPEVGAETELNYNFERLANQWKWLASR